MRTKVSKVECSGGDYFIGDPCYAFSDVDHSFWMELLESCDFFNDLEGKVQMFGKEWTVVASPTQYGDGVYDCDAGFEFPVDAGLIGVVPMELVDLTCGGNPFGMALVNFDRDFTFHAVDDEGTIRIGALEVYTGDHPWAGML